MTLVYNSGEQDIEDNGLSISIAFRHEGNDSPKVVLTNIVDQLLGISDFLVSCSYEYAEVGIDYDMESPSKEYLSLLCFLNKEENKELKELLEKYVNVYEENTTVEDDTIWYYFMIEPKKKEISEEDTLKFQSIFKEVVKVC
jgi:hypothetical protein